MASVKDSLNAPSQFAAAAQAGLDVLSLDQVITFTKYIRVVLPLDGFIFWVRADLVDPSTPTNGLPIVPPGILTTDAAQIVAGTDGTGEPNVSQGPSIQVKGSVHYATDQNQEEDSTYGQNQVVFTAEAEVEDFNEISPSVSYIGEIDDIVFALGTRASFYRQAGLWHYRGSSVVPTMKTQVINSIQEFNGRQLVVSNSLPVWLAIQQPPAYVPYNYPPSFPVFPSFAVPENQPPPYGVIHNVPDSLRALQAAPLLNYKTSTHYQLMSEKVRITLYGVRNDQALDYLDYVNNYSLFTDNIGIMNMPGVRDEKKTQSELNTLAQKKVVEFEVSFYQVRVNIVARQLIKHCIPNYYIGDDPVLPIAPPLSLFGENITVAGVTFDVEQSYAGN